MNPFTLIPASVEHFCGRTEELQRLDDIVAGGGSAVVWSELPSGRSSLLHMAHRRMSAAGRRVVLLDAQTLPQNLQPDEFWVHLYKGLSLPRKRGGSHEPLFAASRQLRPVFLVDYIERLLPIESLRHAEVWGTLRSLTQHAKMSVIGTSVLDIVELNQRSREYNHGSPFFNGMRLVTLGALDPGAVQKLLARTHPLFLSEDRAFIARVAAGHPTFLQRLGSYLWEECARPSRRTRAELRSEAVRQCMYDSRPIFEDAWPLFSASERWFMLRVAVAQRCEIELDGPVETIEGGIPSGRKPYAELRRMLERMHRVELCELLAEATGENAREYLPPLEHATGIEFFDAAVAYIERREIISLVFDRLWQWLPNSHAEVLAIAPAWGWTPPLSPEAHEPVDVEAMQRRGLLTRTMAAPGWHLQPSLLYWWLLDRVAPLARGADRNGWMRGLGLWAVVSFPDVNRLAALVRRHADKLGPGSAPAVEEACRE